MTLFTKLWLVKINGFVCGSVGYGNMSVLTLIACFVLILPRYVGRTACYLSAVSETVGSPACAGDPVVLLPFLLSWEVLVT